MCGRIGLSGREIFIIQGAHIPPEWATGRDGKHPAQLPPVSSHRFAQAERWNYWKPKVLETYQLKLDFFDERDTRFNIKRNQRITLIVHTSAVPTDPAVVCSIVTEPARGSVLSVHNRMPMLVNAWHRDRAKTKTG